MFTWNNMKIYYNILRNKIHLSFNNKIPPILNIYICIKNIFILQLVIIYFLLNWLTLAIITCHGLLILIIIIPLLLLLIIIIIIIVVIIIMM